MVGRLGGADDCHFDIKVAGPVGSPPRESAQDRRARGLPGRAEGRDALDILRLVRAVPIERLAGGLGSPRRQGAERRRPDGRSFPPEPLREDASPGSEMASRAPTPLENEDTIRESCAALAGELLNAVTERMNSFLRDERCHTLGGGSCIRTPLLCLEGPRERAGQRSEQAGGAS